MNPPWVYTCSQSWTPLPPPSPYHPSGSSQCTSPKHPVSCIKPGLAICFIYDIIHVSIPSQFTPQQQTPSFSSEHRALWTPVLVHVWCTDGTRNCDSADTTSSFHSLERIPGSKQIRQTRDYIGKQAEVGGCRGDWYLQRLPKWWAEKVPSLLKVHSGAT